MLVILPSANFHPVAASRKAASYLQKLKTAPLLTSKQGTEIELIPYEVLWEMILGALGKRKKLKRTGKEVVGIFHFLIANLRSVFMPSEDELRLVVK